MDCFLKRTTRCGMAASCLLLCWSAVTVRAQDPPSKDVIAAGSTDGDAVAAEPTNDKPATSPAAQDEIRKALQGAKDENSEQKSSGDPILDDVLQIIRGRGSILEGTALDPNLSEPTARTSSSDPAGAFRAAESLLRSARLLESLPGQDAARQQLVGRLRREALRCLRRAMSPASAAAPQKY